MLVLDATLILIVQEETANKIVQGLLSMLAIAMLCLATVVLDATILQTVKVDVAGRINKIVGPLALLL